MAHHVNAIREEAEKSGTIAQSHMKRWYQDLAQLNQDLHLHQATREIEIKAEQKQQNEQLVATVRVQEEQ